LVAKMAILRRSIDKHDIEMLNAAIDSCRSAGMSDRDLAEAIAAKRKIEQLLAKLGVAVHLQDIEVLKASIDECNSYGLPQRDVQGAVAVKTNVERLLAELTTAIKRKDFNDVKAAIANCPIDMMKTAVIQCHTAGLPENELKEAISAKMAFDLTEGEKKKLLADLSNANDEEMRRKHNECVNLLRESIRAGTDVPAHFEELLNELLVHQVM